MVFDYVLLYSLVWSPVALGSLASACVSCLGLYLGRRGKSTVPVHCKHRDTRVPK